MTELNIDNIKAQMRKGILEYCILSIISRNDAYASSIIAELKAAETDALLEFFEAARDALSAAHPAEKPGASFVPLGRIAARTAPQVLFDHAERPRMPRTTRHRME